MLKIKLLFVIFSLGVVIECPANPWANINKPANIGNSAQSIGTYNGGCLSGAVSLPPDGMGYQLMRLSRKRFYAHPDLKQFIEKLGRSTVTQGLGVLLIGDLGQARGGPTLSGHRSHQTGLDVDIWFLLSKQAEKRSLSTDERETWAAPSVLYNNSDRIDYGQWSAVNEKVLEIAANMPEVDRIFVNPSVKRELCSRKTAHAWLRKIRPWWKHDDHFHVRLKCPKNNTACQSQEPLPQGEGCDAGLAWWFSAEAKKPPAKKLAPEKAPELPALCDRVLND